MMKKIYVKPLVTVVTVVTTTMIAGSGPDDVYVSPTGEMDDDFGSRQDNDWGEEE